MLRVEFWSSAAPAPLEALCEGLTRQNELQLRAAARTRLRLPRLYESTAVYRRDPPGKEYFRSIARVYRPQPTWCGRTDCARCINSRSLEELCGPWLCWFDCDDGAAIVAAEHRHYAGLASRVVVAETDTPGLLHAIVGRPDGTEEDPTAIVRRLRR